MSIDTVPSTDPISGGAPYESNKRWFQGRNLMILLSLAGVVIVSMARVIADADRLTSSTVVGAGLRGAIPIALVGIGGLYAERSGTVNIGLEGIMTVGTVTAGWAGWHWGPWAALVAGIIGGMCAGLLMSLATTTFGVNHIIAGFAINIIGPGASRFLANVWFTTEEAAAAGGSITSSPRVNGNLPRFSVPVLSDGPDLLGDLEGKGWFLLSDLGGVARGLTVDIRTDTLIALVLIVATSYVLWKTPFGLRLRSAGEKPGAAESLGVSVIKMRHVGLAISGAFGGLGGAILVLQGSSQYGQGQVAGRGFLGLAALVFGNWTPSGTLAGALVFGYSDAVSFSLDSGISVRGLILATAIAITVLAIRAVIRGKRRDAAIEFGIAAIAFVAYVMVEEVNRQFVFMTPYIVTLVVITVFAQRQRPPAAEGIPYFKGQSL